ncbi:hypothetical protein T01_4127 [Trichinella spiralis]|uniref:Uncharacterized protein n=1 Tax=Trichinella spiralis TaxID=6334 RepID=A0A0V1AHN5_TRISP|nr:hypothetical protein T01_4127 [Trichinella spiralis]
MILLAVEFSFRPSEESSDVNHSEYYKVNLNTELA